MPFIHLFLFCDDKTVADEDHVGVKCMRNLTSPINYFAVMQCRSESTLTSRNNFQLSADETDREFFLIRKDKMS